MQHSDTASVLVALMYLIAGGLARNPVSGSEWTCGVGYKHFCSPPPPAGKTWVWGDLVP
jgi:hypothetical protein